MKKIKFQNLNTDIILILPYDVQQSFKIHLEEILDYMDQGFIQPLLDESMDQVDLDIDEMSFMLDAQQYVATFDFIRNVFLAPPKQSAKREQRTRRVGVRARPRWLLRARSLPRRKPKEAGAAKASAETAAAASPAAASHFLQNGMDSLYAVMT